MNRTIITIGLLVSLFISGSVFAGTQECEQKKQEIATQENRKRDVENQMRDIDNQIDSVQQQIKALEDRIGTLIAQKNNETDRNRQLDIDNQIKDVENQIIALKQRIVAFEDRKNTKKAEIALIDAEIAKLKKEAEALCNSSQQCDEQKAKLDLYKKSIIGLERDASILRTNIQQKANTVIEFQTKVSGQKATSDKLRCGNMPPTVPDAVIAQCNSNYEDWVIATRHMVDLSKELRYLVTQREELEAKNARVIGRIFTWYQAITRYCGGDSIVAEAKRMSETDVGIGEMRQMLDRAQNDLSATRAIRLPKPNVSRD